MTDVFEIPFAIDLAAVGIGAVQGALAASQIRDRKIDMFGIAIVGILTGFRGGIIRALLLAQVPMALQNNWYLLVATAAALVGMALSSLFHRLGMLVMVLDAVAIGLFGALGTTAALAASLPVLPALFVGVASAVGGGMLRDLFLGQPIAVMHVGSLYAVASGLGCAALVVLVWLGSTVTIAGLGCVAVTVVIRLLAVRFNLYIPEQRSVRLRRPKRR
ncbi:MAG TPA: TRIC cation channel family protein [Microbacteriaceae bacterium]|nr:TRIC cation channel family protein [Microbacteriaceae bacterium]